MRIGYFFHGFLGDFKYDANGNPVSTPDGNATYSWSIIYEAMKRNHQVFLMAHDRDHVGFKKHGAELFSSFAKEKRMQAYSCLQNCGDSFPELDVLLIEWRFPIPGRNTPEAKGSPSYQNDLERQTQLIDHYKTKPTKIIIWDLDHKLTTLDELSVKPDAVFETSARPIKQIIKRTSVEPPMNFEAIVESSTYAYGCNKYQLSYIGSRYERDQQIDHWIKPVSEKFEVAFFGKWDGDAAERWPKIKFCGRITTSMFRYAYANSVGVPLLAKDSYRETGFMTPRPWEALMFGSLPIGLMGHLGVERYTLDTASDSYELLEICKRYQMMSPHEYRRLVIMCMSQIEFMDATYFVDKIEKVV